MKYSRLFVCSSLFTLACGDFAEGADEPLGSEHSEISGGNLVPSIDIVPDSSAVRILTPKDYCSGMKVGSNRFWTAGHCLEGLATGTQLSITNNLSGTFSGSHSYTVTTLTVNVHPARINFTDTVGINRPYNIGHYDVGVFTVLESTPNIPSYSVIDTGWVNETQLVTYTGYGCDNIDPSHEGRKQWANFNPVIDSQLASSTGLSAQFSNDLYHHNIVTLGLPRGCSGDSGAPVWKQFGSTWKTVGIVAYGDSIRDPTGFSRYSNVRSWLNNPALNLFVVGFQGFIFNRYTGRCLGGNVVGNAILSRHCDGRFQDADPQSWRLAPSGGQPGTFYLVNGKTGKCLDLESPDSSNSFLVQNTCLPTSDTTNRQRWSFPAFDPPMSLTKLGTYRQVVSARTGACAFPSHPYVETSDGEIARTAVCSTLDGNVQAWMMTD